LLALQNAVRAKIEVAIAYASFQRFLCSQGTSRDAKQPPLQLDKPAAVEGRDGRTHIKRI
jgi:hypothetical protein